MAHANPASELADLDPVFLVGAHRSRMPDDLFASLRAHVAAECANPDRKSHAGYLAGRIQQGEQILATRTLDPLIKAYLCITGRAYVERMAKLNRVEFDKKILVDFVDSWIVLSREGDYNPIHYHAQSLAGVINVTLPEEVMAKDSPDGKLGFVFGQNNTDNLEFLGSRTIAAPSEGDLFLFPSWLQHVVYPFRGGGERITYAFNLKVRLSDPAD